MRVKLCLTPEEAKGNDRVKIAVENFIRHYQPDYDESSIAESYDVVSSDTLVTIVFVNSDVICEKECLLYVWTGDDDAILIDTFVYNYNASMLIEFPLEVI